ncbi:DUF2642 domain-containing protein [Paenibacillus protaetiae]|uniref:DUF2642 domain-containing protein n=2 Tax=Paenibacillus protaetiae TaxID=2509456 RepID=A0A4P6F2E9_9BACL|nr:DUF2642 domain-containing protein [Paenibacillus protaetiae]
MLGPAGANPSSPWGQNPWNPWNPWNPEQVSPAQTGPAQTFPEPAGPVQAVTNVEPYTAEALSRYLGCCVVLMTTRGPLEGVLLEVTPTYVVLQTGFRRTYVRISEIVWFMPQ